MVHAESRLLGDLYDCPENPALWNRVLDHLCDRLGVRSAVIQVFQHQSSTMHQRWCVRDSESHALRDLHDAFVNNASNPRLSPRVAQRYRAPIQRDADLFDPQCPEFGRLRDNLARIGLGAYVGGYIDLAEGESVGLVLHRCLGDEREFDSADEALLMDLLPHVRRAVRLSETMDNLRSGESVLRAAVDQLRPGLLMCEADGRVRWSNTAASALLGRSRTASLAGDRLRCAGRRDAAALTRFIDGFSPGDTLRLGDADDGDALHLLALQVGAPSKLIMVTEAAAPTTPDIEAVRALFDLSPAEARLAVALCMGKSLNEHAEERGVAIGTARIQLKRILAKTGTHRQGELIRRMCGSAASQAAFHPGG